MPQPTTARRRRRPCAARPGLALLAAATLDGAPENLALGISLTEGTGGVALLAAIFVSNLPEALVGVGVDARAGPLASCRSWGSGARAGCCSSFAVVIGAGPLSGSDPEIVSLPLAFAAGAVIAALADTIMPEAYEHGGPAVALSTAAGFVLSFTLSLA